MAKFTNTIVSTVEYKLVQYDRETRPAGEAEAEGVLKLLNANGAVGWELDRFYDSDPSQLRYVQLLLKRRTSN